MSEKAQKGRFLGPNKLQNHTNKERGKAKKKERGGRKEEIEEKKAIVALLAFIIATLEIVVGRKKLFDTKGLFAGTVFKNLARIFRKMSSIDAK